MNWRSVCRWISWHLTALPAPAVQAAAACKINETCLKRQINPGGGGGVTCSGFLHRAACITTHHCAAAFHRSLRVKCTTQIIGVFMEVQQWDTVVGYFQKWLLECQTLLNESHAPGSAVGSEQEGGRPPTNGRSPPPPEEINTFSLEDLTPEASPSFLIKVWNFTTL